MEQTYFRYTLVETVHIWLALMSIYYELNKQHRFVRLCIDTQTLIKFHCISLNIYYIDIMIQNKRRASVFYGMCQIVVDNDWFEISMKFYIERNNTKFFLFVTTSRRALGSNQPPIQWVLMASFTGAMRPSVNLTTHLHLAPRLRIRRTTSMPPYVLMALHLVKHSSNFTFQVKDRNGICHKILSISVRKTGEMKRWLVGRKNE